MQEPFAGEVLEKVADVFRLDLLHHITGHFDEYVGICEGIFEAVEAIQLQEVDQAIGVE